MSDKKVKVASMVKFPPLVNKPELIKVLAIKKKYLVQIKRFNDSEFIALLGEDYDPSAKLRITDEYSTVRIVGKSGYQILFTYSRGPDPTRHFGVIGTLDLTSVFKSARYIKEGIVWPLSDAHKDRVREIDAEVWKEAELLPPIFED